MSVLSNAKAQMNKIYNGAKQTPIAKGLKGVLYEENLVKKSQTKILGDIYKENKKTAGLMPSLYKDVKTDIKNNLGMDGNMSDIVKANMDKISEVGVDSIEDGNFKKFLNGRFKDDDIAIKLQNRAIVNKAKVNSVQDGVNGLIGKKEASSFILDAAKEVDGQVAFMTPFTMANEYYGKPMSKAIDKVKAGDYKGAFKNAGVAGARVGVSAGVVAGTGAIAHGTANITSNAFNRIRENINSGGQE